MQHVTLFVQTLKYVIFVFFKFLYKVNSIISTTFSLGSLVLSFKPLKKWRKLPTLNIKIQNFFKLKSL